MRVRDCGEQAAVAPDRPDRHTFKGLRFYLIRVPRSLGQHKHGADQIEAVTGVANSPQLLEKASHHYFRLRSVADPGAQPAITANACVHKVARSDHERISAVSAAGTRIDDRFASGLRATVEALTNGKVNGITSRQIGCAHASGPWLSYFFGYLPEEDDSCARIPSTATTISAPCAAAGLHKRRRKNEEQERDRENGSECGNELYPPPPGFV